MAKARYAIVDGGVVQAVTEWDDVECPEWQPPFGTAVSCPANCAVGWLFNGTEFTPADLPKPPFEKSEAHKLIDQLEADGVLSAARASRCRNAVNSQKFW